MAAMERDYFYPLLADRSPPITWSEDGRSTMWQRANQQVKAILDSYKPAYLEGEKDRAIREKFKILLTD